VLAALVVLAAAVRAVVALVDLPAVVVDLVAALAVAALVVDFAVALAAGFAVADFVAADLAVDVVAGLLADFAAGFTDAFEAALPAVFATAPAFVAFPADFAAAWVASFSAAALASAPLAFCSAFRPAREEAVEVSFFVATDLPLGRTGLAPVARLGFCRPSLRLDRTVAGIRVAHERAWIERRHGKTGTDAPLVGTRSLPYQSRAVFGS